jgi:hypothetical protein
MKCAYSAVNAHMRELKSSAARSQLQLSLAPVVVYMQALARQGSRIINEASGSINAQLLGCLLRSLSLALVSLLLLLLLLLSFRRPRALLTKIPAPAPAGTTPAPSATSWSDLHASAPNSCQQPAPSAHRSAVPQHNASSAAP